MKVLLDENLPHDFRHLLTGHQVYTVTYMGWAGLKNGLLLKIAADGLFDLMITMDDSITYQQNQLTLPISLCILSAKSNDIDDLRPLVEQPPAALNIATPRSVIRIV